MNMPLSELQECFLAYILEADDRMPQHIAAPANNSTIERLDVYRDGYYLRLLEILTVDYPVIKTILGEEGFDTLGREYIDAYPSTHFSVRVFGRHLSKFITSQRTYDPMLVEMASFEWMLGATQDAPDAPHLTFEAMAQVPPESWASMQFKLHPSLQLLPFYYNVPEIWKAVDQQQEQPSVTHLDEPAYWRFWRLGITPYFAPLSPPELCMLHSIQADKNFSDICELLCEWFEDEEVVQFAAGTLRTWINDCIISDMRFEAAVAVDNTGDAASHTEA